MDALALLARLASAVPPPKQHQTIYSGVLAAAARAFRLPRTPLELAHPHALAHATREPRAGPAGGPEFPDKL